MSSRPSSAAAPGAAPQDRARTLAHILTVTLDKVPGLREALPRLHELESTLRQRGLAALNDAPLPNYSQIRTAIERLAPHDSPDMQTARAQLLASIDRRARPRPRTLSTLARDEGLFAGEVTMSQFMLEVEQQSSR